MAEEITAEERAAANKRKLQEHLAKLKEGKADFSKKDFASEYQAEDEAAPKEPPKPPPKPSGWEAWKRVHKSRVHDLTGRSREQMAEEADYELLEVRPGASKEEVKKSFNRLAKQFHPDLGGDPEIFQAMRAAHDRIVKGK